MWATKCCDSEREIVYDSNGLPSYAYCEQCDAINPPMKYVEESKVRKT